MVASALAIVVTGCRLAFAQIGSDPGRNADRAEILNSIAEISKAYVARDPGPIERIYLENYASVRGKPVYNYREQLIAMMRADSLHIKAGRRLDFDTISYETYNTEIQFYGMSAIVRGGKKHHWQYKGQKCLSGTVATEIWTKDSGEWKIAAGHASTFHCDPRPFHPVHAAVAAIPARGRPPANADTGSEQQVREIINSLVFARSHGEIEFERILQEHIGKEFVLTNSDGELTRDTALLAVMPPFSTARKLGMRDQGDALLILGPAALYTFKVRTTRSGEVLQQGSVFFAKKDGRWWIAAAHVSRLAGD